MLGETPHSWEEGGSPENRDIARHDLSRRHAPRKKSVRSTMSSMLVAANVADTVPVLDCQSCGRAHTRRAVPLLRRPDHLRGLRRAESAEPSALGAACASPAPRHMRELRGGRSLAAQAMALDCRTMLGPHLVSRARRPCADCSPISVLRLSSWPTSTAATGDGVRALSRSHFSRAARTCSGSTISGFELRYVRSI